MALLNFQFTPLYRRNRNYNNVEIKPETATVTFTAAERREYHSLGANHENIPTIEEAIRIYNCIDSRRKNAKTAFTNRGQVDVVFSQIKTICEMEIYDYSSYVVSFFTIFALD